MKNRQKCIKYLEKLYFSKKKKAFAVSGRKIIDDQFYKKNLFFMLNIFFILCAGEILTVLTRDEEYWWTARNSLGQIGLVPVPYVEKYDEESQTGTENNVRQESGSETIGTSGSSSNSTSNPPSLQSSGQDIAPAATTRRSNIQRTLPAFAKVKQARVPNAYDKTALKLEVGDMIKVTKTNINGQWEGELHGKVGHFPFTHVEFVDNETGEDNQEV